MAAILGLNACGNNEDIHFLAHISFLAGFRLRSSANRTEMQESANGILNTEEQELKIYFSFRSV